MEVYNRTHIGDLTADQILEHYSGIDFSLKNDFGGILIRGIYSIDEGKGYFINENGNQE